MMTARNSKAAFTLAEMLVVISLIVVIAGITIPLFVNTRATTRRSDASNAIRGALLAARQSAVQRRTIVAVEFVSDAASPNRGDYMILVDKSQNIPPERRRLGAPIRLPDFIKFDVTSAEWTVVNGWDGDSNDYLDVDAYPDIAYMPDGSAADPDGTADIAFIDASETARNVLRVLPATGLVVEARHLLDVTQPLGPKDKGWL